MESVALVLISAVVAAWLRLPTLADLWNREDARALRRLAAQTRLCAASGEVVCLPR